MRSQTKLITIVLLALALGFTGCAKKRKDASAENLDTIAEADTAPVDAGTSAEAALPPVDDAKPFDDSPKAPPPEVKTSGDDETYKVQKGDTLMKIAFTIYGDIAQWKNLYDWNRDTLKKASQLEKGMKLKYKKPEDEAKIEHNGDPYMIKKGQTLASIADDIYAKRSKWKKIWSNNRQLIKNPNRIYAGFYLYYQITEAEKEQADKIRAKRGGGSQLGGLDPAPAMPAAATNTETPASAAAAVAPAPVAVPAAAASATASPGGIASPDPALNGASNKKTGKASGGLSGLSGLSRAPAAAPAQSAPTH